MMQQQDAKSLAVPQEKTTPTIEQILQLKSVGILSITQARALVHKYYPIEPVVKSDAVVAGDADGYDRYTTPPPKPRFKLSPRKRYAADMDVIHAEINAKVRPEERFECPERPSKRKKKRPNKASPETAQLRRLVKEITRQRFLKQCMAVDSPLWRKSSNGQRHMNKLLFARAAAKPIATLYKNYPGTLQKVPGRKLISVMQWQVFVFIIYHLLYLLLLIIHCLFSLHRLSKTARIGRANDRRELWCSETWPILTGSTRAQQLIQWKRPPSVGVILAVAASVATVTTTLSEPWLWELSLMPSSPARRRRSPARRRRSPARRRRSPTRTPTPRTRKLVSFAAVLSGLARKILLPVSWDRVWLTRLKLIGN